MALATQCPYCHTSFRVAYDQLKLRGGMVRCGACEQVFNGITYLSSSEHPKPPSEKASPEAIGIDEEDTARDQHPPITESFDQAPIIQPTVLTPTPFQPPSTSADLLSEPDFIKQGRRQRRFGKIIKFGSWLSLIALSLTLLGQIIFLFGAPIAAYVPSTRPLLIASCARLGCQVGLPKQIKSLSVESSQLQSLVNNKDTFELSILLRNQSNTLQAWPYIELTLNDANNQLVTRRVFTPEDFSLTMQDIAGGIAADSEQSLKLLFQSIDAKAAGYRVYPFYP